MDLLTDIIRVQHVINLKRVKNFVFKRNENFKTRVKLSTWRDKLLTSSNRALKGYFPDQDRKQKVLRTLVGRGARSRLRFGKGNPCALLCCGSMTCRC